MWAVFPPWEIKELGLGFDVTNLLCAFGIGFYVINADFDRWDKDHGLFLESVKKIFE